MSKRRAHATVSPSGINDYRDCPHRYYLVRVSPDSPVREETQPLIVGSTVHQWLEEYSTHLIDSGYSQDENVGKSLLEPLLADLDADCSTDVTQIASGLMKEDLFPDSAYDNPTFRVERRVALTKDGDLVDWDSPRAMWRGIFDAIWKAGDMVVIRDWKTNRRIKSRTEVVQDSQLAQYAWAALQLPEFQDCTSVEAWLYYARYKTEVGVQWPRKAVQHTYDNISRYSKRIAKERDWKPRVGPSCTYCMVRNHCEHFTNAIVKYQPFRVANKEDASKAASLYSAIGTARGQLQKELRQYIDDNGPVAVDETSTLNIWVDERVELTDVAGLVKHLDQVEGVDRDALWSSLRITKTDIVSLLKSAGYTPKKAREKAAELLHEYGVVKHSSRMEIRKND